MIPILLSLAVIVILIVVIVAGQPDVFTVTRSSKISASPAEVFLHVNDLNAWENWSPWAKLDPDVKNSFAGAASGVGAAMSWAGNKKVGTGRMIITGSQPNELIRIRLEFLKPFKATNAAKFIFQTEGDQSVVTWSMSGKNNFFFKVFGLFMNCDQMVGRDFEKGLANLKSVVEAT